jgi:uncharacterized protein
MAGKSDPVVPEKRILSEAHHRGSRGKGHLGFRPCWTLQRGDTAAQRHGVTAGTCEQVFFQEPLLVTPDPRHSQDEERWAALGRTADGRSLAIVFTLRGELIRPISARDMSRKERRLCAKAEKEANS